MADDTNTTNNRHTVGFSRKLNLGNYQSSEASIFIQVDTTALGDGDIATYLADVLAKVNLAYVAAKGAVLDTLGIEYTQGEDGELVETNAHPAVDAVTLVRNGFGGGEVVPQPDNYGNAIDPTTMSKPDQKKWVTARLDTNPDEFLDNRQAKRDGFFMTRDGRRFDVKPTTPDYKHKSTGLGVWV